MSDKVERFLEATCHLGEPMSLRGKVELFNAMSKEEQEMVRKVLYKAFLKEAEEAATEVIEFSEDEA